MTKPDWCPQWAWDAANMAVVHAPDYTQRLHEDVARGLLEAERRGMERAAEIAAERLCPDTAKAIRAAASRDS